MPKKNNNNNKQTKIGVFSNIYLCIYIFIYCKKNKHLGELISLHLFRLEASEATWVFGDAMEVRCLEALGKRSVDLLWFSGLPRKKGEAKKVNLGKASRGRV